MNFRSVNQFIIVASILWMSPGIEAFSQSRVPTNWQDHAESRLKEIYEGGAFRVKNLQAEWLSDSSGFITREPDPETKEPVAWFHDVHSGQRRQWKPAERSLMAGKRSLSPYGVWDVTTRDRRLSATHQISGEEKVLMSAPEGRDIHYRDPVWSPDGTRIAFVEVDVTDVRERAVLVPTDPSYPGVQQHRFARVAEKIEKLRVGMIKDDGTELNWLPIEVPAEGYYLGQVDWAGNSNELLVEKFNRFRNRRDCLLFDRQGKSTTIFSESSETWVESSQGKNSGLTWIRNGEAFIVITEQDGWRHAYLYSRGGKQIACLTSGDYDIIDRASVDEANGWYYFYASPHEATQKYLYRVKLDGTGELQRISPENQFGTHNYLFSPDTRWAIHTYSTLDTPPVIELVEIETHRVHREIEAHTRLREKMKSISVQPTEFLKLDIGDGIVLDALLVKPGDFDATKKYPVVVYVYGEPHAQTVLNEWGAAQIDFHRVVAEMGYCVVSIDNRGTPAPKGAAWRRSVFRSLGPLSTEEQAAGLKALAQQCPFIDLSRVGIWGWSGGGTNTLNALFRKPDLYHVGIAVVPKPQPHLYNAWFQEMYMQTPEVNPDGYQQAAAINYAAGLKGKLLIITGSGETNTHIEIIEGLIDRLIALGKSFDYMVYPHRDHGLREGEGTLVHVRMRILRYLLENLPPGAV